MNAVLIELNLDEKIVAKIKELLEDGTYENDKELIIRAIENLYERTKAVGETTTLPIDRVSRGIKNYQKSAKLEDL